MYNLIQSLERKQDLHDNVITELRDISNKLFFLLQSENLPHDCSLIMSTSLVLLIPYICNGSPRFHFVRLICKTRKGLDQYSIEKENLDISPDLLSQMNSSCPCILSNEDFEHIIPIVQHLNPTYATLLLLHGLFNSNDSFLFDNDFKVAYTSNFYFNSKYLIHFFPILKKLCLSLSSHIYQAFQALYLWCQCLRKLNSKLKSSEDKEEENNSYSRSFNISNTFKEPSTSKENPNSFNPRDENIFVKTETFLEEKMDEPKDVRSHFFQFFCENL